MPSPRFGTPDVLVDAVALAIREAWACKDTDRRIGVANLAVRRALGPTQAGEKMADALLPALSIILRVQPTAPAGDVEPNHQCLLELCVRCRQVKLFTERKAFRNKIHMEYLRDRDWLTRQCEQLGKSDAQIAEELGCCKQSVQIWRHKHDINPGKSSQPWMQEAVMRKLIEKERLGPGEVAERLGCQVWTVKGWARKLGLATIGGRGSYGWAHLERVWWAERHGAGWTQERMARAAGIEPHAALYHLRRFGLPTKRDLHGVEGASRLKPPKFPQLYEPGFLSTRITRDQHGEYRGLHKIARQIGCSETAVKRAAQKLGIIPPDGTYLSAKPSPWTDDPEWYRSRIAQKQTVEQMAVEAGCKPKSIWNYLGELGLLDEYHRLVERWSDKQLEKTRKDTMARLAGRRTRTTYRPPERFAVAGQR